MDKLKQWVALTVILVLAVGAGGWFLLISPKRGDAADLQAQAAAQEATNDGLKTQLSVLKAQDKDKAKKQAELADFYTKVPPVQGTPALIRSLVTAADSAGVELVSVTPAVVVASADKTATGPAGTLLDAAVDLKVAGSYSEIQQFLTGIETLPRALRTTSLELSLGINPATPVADVPENAAENGTSLVATITAHTYVAAAAGAANPPAPAPAATTTATATSTPTPTPSASTAK